MREIVVGALRRDGASWRIEAGVRNVRLTSVLEANPTALVGRKRRWLISSTKKRGVVAQLADDLPDEELLKRGATGNIKVVRSVRTISGGAPGLGRRRRG